MNRQDCDGCAKNSYGDCSRLQYAINSFIQYADVANGANKKHQAWKDGE